MLNKQFRKPFRYKKFKKIKIYSKLIYGLIGLQVLGDLYLKKEHIISVIKAIKSILRKKNILCLRVFFNKIYTKKPTDVRMGRGKGNGISKICILKKGNLLLELKSVNFYKSVKALQKASIKLPVKTHIIYKNIKK
jgi:large subunit ribosomal protein L16